MVYIGVNGISRNIISFNQGVGGVSRKCKTGYIGVNSIAKQFLESYQIYLWTNNPQNKTVYDLSSKIADGMIQMHCYAEFSSNTIAENMQVYAFASFDVSEYVGQTITIDITTNSDSYAYSGFDINMNLYDWEEILYVDRDLSTGTHSYTIVSGTEEIILVLDNGNKGAIDIYAYINSIKIGDTIIF